MNKISAGKYVEGVKQIYAEQPDYETGGDGSGGKCDCIGMCRGGLERGGATDVKNMRGTNQAARKTILDLQELKSEAPLVVGDVVLKVRDKDDPSMPLPEKYRKGGSEYDPTWDETNFTHIGTVTKVNPIEITHMTSPKPKIDKDIKGWGYFGELPWVEYKAAPEPPPEPEPDPDPEPDMAVVVAESGSTVKMRDKPSQDCKLYWDVPIGAEVIVDEWHAKTDKKGNSWSRITWNNRMGWMMTQFLQDEDSWPYNPDEPIKPADPDKPIDPPVYRGPWTVTIPGLTKDEAEDLCREWGEATMKRG